MAITLVVWTNKENAKNFIEIVITLKKICNMMIYDIFMGIESFNARGLVHDSTFGNKKFILYLNLLILL
ncbi:MAG: hypothetical protein N3A69_16325 [Leptospiraceae bacterium]|nr:hypothetical protein [Leptospiraceae bacterium]